MFKKCTEGFNLFSLIGCVGKYSVHYKHNKDYYSIVKCKGTMCEYCLFSKPVVRYELLVKQYNSIEERWSNSFTVNVSVDIYQQIGNKIFGSLFAIENIKSKCNVVPINNTSKVDERNQNSIINITENSTKKIVYECVF